MDRPIRIAVVDDYEVVIQGVAAMLAPFDEVEVVHTAIGEKVTQHVDLALFDTFGQAEAHTAQIDLLLASDRSDAVAIYTWNLSDELVRIAAEKGILGYFSKAWSAERLVAAIVLVAGGTPVLPEPVAQRPRPNEALQWPGKEEGLTAREAQVLALIVAGHGNREVGELLFISVNSVKTHVRNLYAKIGASRRSQAVVWGVDHGLRASASAVQGWVS